MIFLLFIFSFFTQFDGIKENSKNDAELIINIAKTQLGKEYVGGTLDTGFIENCVFNYEGLDCVTFVENTLAIAKSIKNNDTTEESIIKNIENTRYRDGKLTDYISRLHYTGDWINDNIRRNNLKDITKEIGGIKLNQNVNFMSSHPQYYKQLKDNETFQKQIKEVESQINKHDLFYIPKDKVNKSKSKIQSGDIICITTNIKGLDYSHLGFAIREGDKLKLIHASSTKMQVTIENDLQTYLMSVKNHKGITILRPIL